MKSRLTEIAFYGKTALNEENKFTPIWDKITLTPKEEDALMMLSNVWPAVAGTQSKSWYRRDMNPKLALDLCYKGASGSYRKECLSMITKFQKAKAHLL